MVPLFVALLLALPSVYKAGSIKDIEHIVVFMQENRAFDHYYGTLNGVRGFNDRSAPTLPNGRPVFYQPTSSQPPVPPEKQLCGCGSCDLKWLPNSEDLKDIMMSSTCKQTINDFKSATPPVSFSNGERCSKVLKDMLKASLYHLNISDYLDAKSSCASNVIVKGLTNSSDALFSTKENYMLPFPLSFTSSSATCMPAPRMEYHSDIKIWNQGRMDAWNTAREAGFGMSYFNRTDLPYYYDLADAFTVGDQYYQSTLTPTNPNRLHFFSGSNGLSVNGSVNILDDSEPETGINWETMAETLEKSNISWKVYQQENNFDDNSFAWFEQFRTAKPDSPLYKKGMIRSKDFVADFASDIAAGTLPQVSWLVAPSYLSEHATNHPADGEDLTARLMKVLADPKSASVYAKMAFILNYDEGGQFVDHIWPPTPPVSENDGKSTVSVVGEVTKHENLGIPAGHPIGLGFRVPLMIISPWTRGHLVFSQVSDHTSVLKFIEKRFGVFSPNISPWRRAVVSDLTAAFDFNAPDYSWPTFPNTRAYVNTSKWQCEHLPPPVVPIKQFMPSQESGTRVSRPLPYDFSVVDEIDKGIISLKITNRGGAGASFLVFNRLVSSSAPRKYTVEGGKELSDSWPTWPETGDYNLHVHGPNGFVRKFSGSGIATLKRASASLEHHPGATSDGDHVRIAFGGRCSPFLVVDNSYGAKVREVTHGELLFPTSTSNNWYDITVTTTCGSSCIVFSRTYMGHMETPGRSSTSDPAMAISRPEVTINLHPEVPEFYRNVERWSDRKNCASARSRHKDQCWHIISDHDEL